MQSPLQQLEHRLHNWVDFFRMPVFAFSNAGANFTGGMTINFSLAINIALSLFLGKIIGASLLSYLGLKLKMAVLPEGVVFQQIRGVALLEE